MVQEHVKVWKDTPATRKEEKRINAYIEISKLPLEKIVGKRIFDIFLKAIPIKERDFYEKYGIPFWHKDVKYTLVVKNAVATKKS